MNNAQPLPLDVRLMNVTAVVLFAGLIVMGVASGVWWLLRHPMFSIGAIVVQGDVTHNNALTLRANVAPRLSGNFFTLDLAAARAAFESVPWVRTAVVQREFPNRLRVRLQEHEAVAYWGEDDDGRMVNTFGEVFEANAGDVEHEDLPRLSGPDGQSALVLQTYQALRPQFASIGCALEALELSARGGWRAQLDNDAVIELGRGTTEEVLARVQRFARTLRQVTAKYGRTPEAVAAADLRYGDGYALQLRGVTTLATDAAAKP